MPSIERWLGTNLPIIKGETKMNVLNGKQARYLLMLTIATLVGPELPAIAGDDVACAIYAKTAVAQQQQNIQQKCGFSGPEWSSDYNYHAKWCINVPQNLADNGTSNRVGMLKKCQGVQFPAGADKWCNIYSIIAIGQNAANLSTKCGLIGPEWNSDYSYHYTWCVKAPKANSVAGMDSRRNKLMQCSQ